MSDINQTKAILASIGAAFVERDFAGIEKWLADDVVFHNGNGDDGQGRKYIGKAEVISYFRRLFEATPDVRWVKLEEYASGNDTMVFVWDRFATLKDGTVIKNRGLDIYTVKDGLVVKKNTFIKNTASPKPFGFE